MDIMERIENDFKYHAPIAEFNQSKRYECIREEAKKLAQFIVSTTPDSRERALALTKIEEAVFWANAAIARNEKLNTVITKNEERKAFGLD